MSAVLDTHAVIWYLMADARLPAGVIALLRGDTQRRQPSVVSAVSLVEMVYLAERGPDRARCLRSASERGGKTRRFVPRGTR